MVQFCREGKDGLTITLHVQPRAKKTEIIGVHGDALKMKVAAPPVDGAANVELTRFFARFLGVPKKNVRLKHGEGSRHKILEVDGVTTADLIDMMIRHGLLTISLG